ncbi:MAG: ATP-binding protein [Thermodesulfovibrionales bacterium]
MMLSGIKSFLRRLSLLQKFSAAVILLIFFIGLVFTTLIISHQRSVLRSEMERGHVVMVRTLAKDAVEAMIVLDPLRLDELVRTIAHTPGCASVGILDQAGRVVAHTNRRLLGEIQKRQAVEEPIITLTKEGKREIVVPIKAGYEAIGIAFASFEAESVEGVIDADSKNLKRYILIISVMMGAAGIWGAVLLARFLTTPLKKVKDEMEQIQAGNLDVRISHAPSGTCVELLDCTELACPAYGKTRCWTVPGTLCGGVVQGDAAGKICECKSCLVYREYCGDEVGEVVEVFNQMVQRLRMSIMELEETTREKARLEKLSALGEMSMTMAHEIKNPLNAIRGATSYLAENFEGEVLREFLAIIDEETRRLNEIVTSILRYSRPTPLRLQTADINKVIRETAELVRQEATENNVEVILHLAADIPFFSFDPQQVKQALLNILVNSLDASEEADTICISSAVVDSRVHIVIKDTGKGISEEVLADIFKPFFTTKTRGSGLGLACVERIVRDHKGDITVKSEAGNGAEFAITLPFGD